MLRHNVRYTPLGRKRKVKAEYFVGTERRVREVEILDESAGGLALGFEENDGLAPGLTIVVRNGSTEFQTTVANVAQLPNKLYRVGLRFKASK